MVFRFAPPRAQDAALSMAALALLALPASAVSMQSVAEEQIGVVLADFVAGWREADLSRLRRVAAPVGRVFWADHEAGRIGFTTFEDLLEGRTPRPGYGEPWRLLSLEVIDDRMAWAVLEVADRAGPVTDHLMLYRFGTDWRVVANVFHVAAAQPFGAGASPSDDAVQLAAREALAGYVRGWREADKVLLGNVFDPEAGAVFWVSETDGRPALAAMSFADILKRDRGPRLGYGEPWEVLRLEVVGNEVAVATLHISRQGGSYTDLLALCRVAGTWRIVSKMYSSRPD